jgi:demethylmenaquinone methyltransferase/2-methoxy-6-polyprenyl-1,4-benzoquinol methylase
MTRLWTALAVCLVALVAHQVMFSNVSAPPADFGSGSMFDLIARRYDMINRVLAVGMDIGWRKRMVNVLAESVAEQSEAPRLLDVATGTADVALLLAELIPAATVVGVDPSANMLAVGREKIQDRGLTDRVRLELQDARQGFDDSNALATATFDGATMAFGIRNIAGNAQKEQAFCQIHRALRDQALFCILEFSEPDDSFGVMGAGARFFIRHVIPFLGGILSGKPREYWHLQHSIQDFPAPPDFVKLIESTVCETGIFRVEDLVQLNFGSVQLYVSRTMRKLDGGEKATGSGDANIQAEPVVA